MNRPPSSPAARAIEQEAARRRRAMLARTPSPLAPEQLRQVTDERIRVAATKRARKAARQALGMGA